LLNGWDDIDMTRQHADTITDFANRYSAQFPWTAAQPPESTIISKG